MTSTGPSRRPAAAHGATHPSAYADLVTGLLDAREDAATTRFDAALNSAVAAGEVSADAARALRFWQRAAVRGVVEHARTVLPAALGALDVARHEAAERTAADRQVLGETDPAVQDTSRDLSTTVGEQPSSLEARRHRLIVAGLTSSTTLDLRAHR